MFAEQYRKQHINYKKFYFVSNKYKKRGDLLKNASLFIGLILLFVLGGLISGLLDQGIIQQGIANNLVTLLFVFSSIATVVTVFEVKEEWGIKATRYHKYGQVHQNLFTDIEYIIKTKFDNSHIDIEELKKDYKRIIKRKDQLNQVSPHISSEEFRNFDIDIEIDPTAGIDEFQTVAEVRGYGEENSALSAKERLEGITENVKERDVGSKIH